MIAGLDVVAFVVHAEVEGFSGEMNIVRGDLVAQNAAGRTEMWFRYDQVTRE